MLGPQTATTSVIDSLSGSMEEWYEAVDASIKKSDVIPGNYEYTVNTSYGNVGRIVEGSSTHFDISCDRFKIISLENSYITLKQTVNVTIPQMHHTPNNGGFANSCQWWYIGYKSAFDAIAQYRLYSNSDHVQTQNHANYEWFAIYNSISDEAKENCDTFATIDKIRKMSPFVPGTYIRADTAANRTVPVTFDIKIPLNSFLALYNLKYYPNWAGKLTIEVYPSYRNIVVAPVLGVNETVGGGYLDAPAAYNGGNTAQPQNVSAIPDSTLAAGTDIGQFNFGFTQINQQENNNFNNNAANTVVASARTTFTCNGDGCFVDECKIRLATYLLKIDLFNALAAKYTNVPLIFPIQTTQIKDFTSELPVVANQHFTTANTIALKHCDAMFLVFKQGVYATTCFNNPFLNGFRVNVDGKFYPREELNTYDDRRFINLTLDALNLNNNALTSINKDLSTSLQPFASVHLQAANNNFAPATRRWNLGDYSNFMIGIPFCDSDEFMGGISTVGTVQIELSGQRANIAVNRPYQVTAICFEDCYLKIRAVKPDGRSQIEITNATIEQMALGGL